MCWFRLLALVLLASFPAVAAVPEVTRDADGLAYWVVAPLVLDRTGNPDHHLLSYQAGNVVELLLARRLLDGRCIEVEQPTVEVVRPPWLKGPVPVRDSGELPIGSLDELIDMGNWIVHGRVIDRQGGFLVGRPGTTIELEPITTYRGDPDERNLLLFLPVGRIYLGRDLCINASDERFGPVPEIGDEVVFFSGLVRKLQPDLPIASATWAIVTIDRSGAVRLPPPFEAAPLTKTRLLERLSSLTATP